MRPPRPGGWDPAERLKDMAIDGVAAEVLYTTLGFRLFGLTDASLPGRHLSGLQRLAGRVLPV